MSPLSTQDIINRLPTFQWEFPEASVKTLSVSNHLLISYFLGELEVHSAKFYTALLDNPDVVQLFLDQLEIDAEVAYIQHSNPKLQALFNTPSPFETAKPAEPKYVVNVQPILDAAPSVPGLVKSHDPKANLGDEHTIIDYSLSDGFPFARYEFEPADLQSIYAGTYDPADNDEYESFIEAMETALEGLADLGVIKKVQA